MTTRFQTLVKNKCQILFDKIYKKIYRLYKCSNLLLNSNILLTNN